MGCCCFVVVVGGGVFFIILFCFVVVVVVFLGVGVWGGVEIMSQTLIPLFSPMFLSKLRRLWPSVSRQVA